MATQTAEREMVIQEVEQYQENDEWNTSTRTVEQPKERKAGFFSKVGNMLWRAYFLTPSGFFIPCEPPLRHCDALSPREQAWIEAQLKGL